MLCSDCGSQNDTSAKICVNCGSELHHTTSEQGATGKIESEVALFKAFIGEKNQAYYLQHFIRFNREQKSSTSWHWPAFFTTFYWLLYRKMWLPALIYFFLPHALTLPAISISMAVGDLGWVAVAFVYGLYFLAAYILPPLYANTFYYRHANNKIAEVKATSNDLQSQLTELAAKGGTSVVVLVAAIIVPLLTVVGLIAALGIPTYQDYTIRTNLNQAVMLGRSATKLVNKHYSLHQMLPNNLLDEGFTKVLPESIQSVELNSENGVISVRLATAPVAGKLLLFVPTLEENNKITWQCIAEHISNKYLPHECRQEQ